MDHDPTTVVSEGVPKVDVPADALVPQRLRVDLKERHWMARTLQTWRAREEIPTIADITGSSCPSRPLPFTGECVECTIPLLVALCEVYEHQIHTLDLDLGHAQEDLGYLRNLREHYWTVMADQEQFDQALRTASDRLVGTERRLADLKERTTVAEQRVEAVEKRCKSHNI
ncbi:hypothetical protein L1987_27647 [Smallanthus sonchifolius]|uniref:Uncharacterized protein n=1 Tax=Smallanthus sonchifolius TaxID=185202 RepID=A0ACB9IBI6_9ASTR|nr:hypothetical protein L1987_27647 [Smallanthus sonchifolius]